ncbi:hypothetical protein CEXT_477451 [Caerostris extrusa]|uniref:Uncharacterized protein n=1 Tax=Caerostris extrusa TaxID=172846 RepID=A0AAV4X876_CAEEX|nr:hypothetical protein CEXT_477451 [Caerostris extrusa]
MIAHTQSQIYSAKVLRVGISFSCGHGHQLCFHVGSFISPRLCDSIELVLSKSCWGKDLVGKTVSNSPPIQSEVLAAGKFC